MEKDRVVFDSEVGYIYVFSSGIDVVLLGQQQGGKGEADAGVAGRRGDEVATDQIGRIDAGEAGTGDGARARLAARVIVVRPVAFWAAAAEDTTEKVMYIVYCI